MTSPSPHPTEQLSSLLTREETPGSFPQDWIPYDMSGKTIDELHEESMKAFVELCRVLPVKQDESASDTYLRSHTQGLEDCLTRLEEALSRMETTQQRTLQVLESLVDSLAEDDEDEQPRTYMDGSPV